MPKKISSDQEELIIKRLKQGCTLKEISEELEISITTVKNYKKKSLELLDADSQDKSTSFNVHYTKPLTKLQEQYNSKIKDDIFLYEDTEEGWIYHLKKNDIRRRQSGKWWMMIVYPDSAPENWMEVMKVRGFNFRVGPLHDKDKWSHDNPVVIDNDTGEIVYERGEKYQAGDKKKAHYHVIVILDQRTGYLEINAELQKLTHCPYIQKCRSLKNANAYLTHENHPDRYQYDKDEIKTFNNFHLEPNKWEMNELMCELFEIIKEHEFEKYKDVVNYFLDEPEMMMLITTRSASVSKYVNDIFNSNHPDFMKHVKIFEATEHDIDMQKSIEQKASLHRARKQEEKERGKK